MKFFAYAALVYGISALSLSQMSAGLVQEEMNLELSAFEDKKKKAKKAKKAAEDLELLKKGKKPPKEEDVELEKKGKKCKKAKKAAEDLELEKKGKKGKPEKDDSDDDKEAVMEDFKKAVEAELAKDGDVDLEELYDIVETLAEKYEFKLPKGWKKHVKKMFDYVDANGDGKVTGAEIEAAMKKEPEDEEDDIQVAELDPKDDFEAAIKAELDKDGSVTLKELYGIIKGIAKKYKVKLPKGWTKYVKKIFDYVDANSDGKVTGEEIEAAMKKEPEDDEELELEGPKADFEAAIKAELEKDGSVTLDELFGIIKSIAKKYKVKLPKGWTKYVKKIFDYVDANSDGKVTGPEIEAAMAKEGKDD